VGVQIWFLVAGVAMALMGVGALFVPAIMRLEDTANLKSAGTAGIDDPLAVPASAR